MPIDAAKQVQLRDVLVKFEALEELVLHATLMAHHSDPLPSPNNSRIGNLLVFLGRIVHRPSFTSSISLPFKWRLCSASDHCNR